MHTILIVFAVIGALAVAFAVFALVTFISGINKNGWNQ